jgi:hypothetical protein
MSLPGFSAELGLYRSSRVYLAGDSAVGRQTSEIVVPAMCNQTAYEQCIASNQVHMPPGSLEVYCLTQYGCLLNGDICVGEGASKHCAFSGEFTCGGRPCPVGHPCCEGTCCSPGDFCCGETCCKPGQVCCNGICRNIASDPNNCGRCDNVCKNGDICCNGTCCGVDSCCAGPQNAKICCPAGPNSCNDAVVQPGYTCCNGNAIPPTSQLKSWSQYFLYAPGCGPIEGLKVIFDASQEPMVSNTGFSVQLNAFQQGTLGNWLQFIFFVDSNGAISANIQDHTTSTQYPGGSSKYANFTNTNQYLSIELIYDRNESVNGAIFSACNSDGTSCESHPLSVPNPSHHSVNAFQVNVVFDPGGPLPAYATFTEGSGSITYRVARGQRLCNLGINPAAGLCDTSGNNTYQFTAEQSNVVYDSISSATGSCCGEILTQKFGAPA